MNSFHTSLLTTYYYPIRLWVNSRYQQSLLAGNLHHMYSPFSGVSVVTLNGRGPAIHILGGVPELGNPGFLDVVAVQKCNHATGPYSSQGAVFIHTPDKRELEVCSIHFLPNAHWMRFPGAWKFHIK